MQTSTEAKKLSGWVYPFVTLLVVLATAGVSLVQSLVELERVRVFLYLEGGALLACALFRSLTVLVFGGLNLEPWLAFPGRETLAVIGRQPLLYVGFLCLLGADLISMFV